MSKIKTINIDNFGSYKNYTWINNDTEFKDINIIYGRNYSGKTTLSRIFRCLENKSLHNDYENQNFCFTLEDNSSISNDSISTIFCISKSSMPRSTLDVPGITKVGFDKYLYKFSLDQFPSLFTIALLVLL